jgi:hypothetical protein
MNNSGCFSSDPEERMKSIVIINIPHIKKPLCTLIVINALDKIEIVALPVWNVIFRVMIYEKQTQRSQRT